MKKKSPKLLLQRILADDPGSKNYGRSIVKTYVVGTSLKFKVEQSLLVEDMIEELKGDAEPIIKGYLKRAKAFERVNGPFDVYCAERYMNRGIKGTLIECVSMMLNSNVLAFSGNKRLIAAVTWKTPFKRLFDLDMAYKACRPAPPHLLDSTLIAIYASHLELGLKPFEFLSLANLQRIVAKLSEIGEIIKANEKAKRDAARRKR